MGRHDIYTLLAVIAILIASARSARAFIRGESIPRVKLGLAFVKVEDFAKRLFLSMVEWWKEPRKYAILARARKARL